MTKNLESKIANAFQHVATANDLMIECIIQSINENGGETSYEVVVDESCGYNEQRTISFNEDGECVIYNENGYEIVQVEDLSTDELYNICLKLS
jgi:hypothetical protein